MNIRFLINVLITNHYLKIILRVVYELLQVEIEHISFEFQRERQ